MPSYSYLEREIALGLIGIKRHCRECGDPIHILLDEEPLCDKCQPPRWLKWLASRCGYELRRKKEMTCEKP
jgi:hypothetical protein